MPTPAAKKLQIFRSGTHTDMNGHKLEFTADDVGAIVRNYDPAKFCAPLVVGHPKHNDPAYGWVASLSETAGGVLEAEPKDVEPQFAEMVKSGRFRKISASLFCPDHPSNPVPGEYYLRHVGFLGAAAPAIPGLKQAEFGADDLAHTVTVEFGEADGWSIKSALRSLRDFLIDQFGTEKADKALPGWLVDSAERPEPTPCDPAYTAPPTPEDSPMPTPAELAAAQAAHDKAKADAEAATANLAAREQQLQQREAAIATQLAQARHANAVSFVDGLIAGKVLLPADKASAVEAIAAVDAITAPVEFAEGDGKKTEPVGTVIRRLLSAKAKGFDFSEKSRDDGERQPHAADFSTGDNEKVDAGAATAHAKILAYQQANKCDYKTAALAVGF